MSYGDQTMIMQPLINVFRHPGDEIVNAERGVSDVYLPRGDVQLLRGSLSRVEECTQNGRYGERRCGDFFLFLFMGLQVFSIESELHIYQI